MDKFFEISRPCATNVNVVHLSYYPVELNDWPLLNIECLMSYTYNWLSNNSHQSLTEIIK